MESEYTSHSEKYDEELLSEGMIANAKLLSNDKYEYDNIMMLFSDRLKIIPNGTTRISKKIKVNCFNDRYVYRFLSWPISYKGHKDDFRDSIYELSNVTTALFSHKTLDREYIGLEQIINHGDKIECVGSGLNCMVNTLYTLMASYTKYLGDITTPNDLMFNDMILNMKNDPSLYYVTLNSFNLARLLLVVSENFPDTNYNMFIFNKKSPINTRKYNYGGDNIVLNDLLYAGKYGKAAREYSKIFDNYAGYEGAYDELLRSYDTVFDSTIKGQKVDIEAVKKIIKIIYLYYGSKYLKMKENNSLDQKSLLVYKQKVMNAFDSVIKQYDIKFNYNDLLYKEKCEKVIEYLFTQDKNYYKLSKTKESFEPQDQVPVDADNKAREIKLKYKLGE